MKNFAFAIAALTVGLAPVGAWAQQNPDELKKIEERLKDRAAEEQRLRQEAEAREREVASLRHSLIETANSLQDAERRITSLEDSIAELEAERIEAEAALKLESENLSDVLAALQSLEMGRPPALLVSPQDANEAARAAMLLADAAPAVQARADRLRDAIDRLTTLSASLDAERRDLAAANDALTARRTVLAELMGRKEKERDVAASLAAAAQRETAQLAARATTLREVLERLERLAHSVTPRIKPAAPRRTAQPAAPSGLTPPSIKQRAPQPYIAARRFEEAKGALRAPVAGRLTGRFGADRPEGGKFSGVRFLVRDQAIVTAPFEGRVVFARDWQPIGNLIVLDVGDGFHVLLGGVGAILVEEGQRVAAGEPVAEMAQGGAALDLEIRKNGEPVNPVLWLSRNSMEDPAP